MKTNNFQILIGATALLLGSLIYLIDRPPDQTYFVYSAPVGISLYNIFLALFGPIGNSLPESTSINFPLHLLTLSLILPCEVKKWLH